MWSYQLLMVDHIKWLGLIQIDQYGVLIIFYICYRLDAGWFELFGRSQHKSAQVPTISATDSKCTAKIFNSVSSKVIGLYTCSSLIEKPFVEHHYQDQYTSKIEPQIVKFTGQIIMFQSLAITDTFNALWTLLSVVSLSQLVASVDKNQAKSTK